MSTGKRASKPTSAEEFIRKTFEGGKHTIPRDHTPRTFQPDGSMTTEDWLREVVFGVDRATTPIREAAALKTASSPQEDPPTPFGWGTALVPGKDALSRERAEKAGAPSASAAEEKAARQAAAKMAQGILSRHMGITPFVAHGATKGVNEAVDLIYTLGEKTREHLPEALDYSLNWDFRKDGKGFSLDKGAPVAVPNLPQMFPEPQTAVEKAASGMGQFGVGYFFGNKLLKFAAPATRGASIAKSLGTGAIADFVAFDGKEAGISEVIQQYPALAGPVTEYLADRANGGEIEGRLKNVLEGLGLNASSEAFMHGLRGTKSSLQNIYPSVYNDAKFKVSASDAARQAAFKERQPVVSLTGKEFPYSEVNTLRHDAERWYKNNWQGGMGTIRSWESSNSAAMLENR